MSVAVGLASRAPGLDWRGRGKCSGLGTLSLCWGRSGGGRDRVLDSVLGSPCHCSFVLGKRLPFLDPFCVSV